MRAKNSRGSSPRWVQRLRHGEQQQAGVSRGSSARQGALETARHSKSVGREGGTQSGGRVSADGRAHARGRQAKTGAEQRAGSNSAAAKYPMHQDKSSEKYKQDGFKPQTKPKKKISKKSNEVKSIGRRRERP